MYALNRKRLYLYLRKKILSVKGMWLLRLIKV